MYVATTMSIQWFVSTHSDHCTCAYTPAGMSVGKCMPLIRGVIWGYTAQAFPTCGGAEQATTLRLGATDPTNARAQLHGNIASERDPPRTSNPMHQSAPPRDAYFTHSKAWRPHAELTSGPRYGPQWMLRSQLA
ncbi:hypothetical protein PSPO01_13935 [Paraphaeosphaeria sporulosa]